MTKWIVVQGMMSVEQAKALQGCIAVGLEGLDEHIEFVEAIDKRLDRAIDHVENQGFAGSGIVIEGNMHLPRDEPEDRDGGHGDDR